jgi:hypothetical protein
MPWKDRNVSGGPEATGFLERQASARKLHLAAGKRLGGEGFGRGRPKIIASKAGDGSQVIDKSRRTEGCKRIVCEENDSHRKGHLRTISVLGTIGE